MSSPYSIVLTTTNSPENRDKLINEVLQQQLAACIQTLAIDSHYVWKGEVCSDNEILLIIKTTRRCYPALEQLIAEHHVYETPQIVQIPFKEGFNPYLAWLNENTRR